MDERTLIRDAQAGNRRAVERLLENYRGFTYSIADRFRLPGYGFEDARQEGMIGLHIAIARYDGRSSLKSFIALVVERRLQTALRLALREKHRALTESIREILLENGDLVDVLDTLSSPRARDPYLVAVDNERLRDLIAKIATLSPFERKCLTGVVNGLSYAEIENVCDSASMKRVDNALFRARLKLAA